MEDFKAKEAQLKANNKVCPSSVVPQRRYSCPIQALREELRKVQSSAALLERQRNPGVGYWSVTSPRTASSPNGASSSPNLPLRPEDSPRNSFSSADGKAPAVTPKEKNAEEEVNLEYLRNIILQFLEHPQMRVRFAHPSHMQQTLTRGHPDRPHPSSIYHPPIHAPGNEAPYC